MKKTSQKLVIFHCYFSHREEDVKVSNHYDKLSLYIYAYNNIIVKDKEDYITAHIYYSVLNIHKV